MFGWTLQINYIRYLDSIKIFPKYLEFQSFQKKKKRNFPSEKWLLLKLLDRGKHTFRFSVSETRLLAFLAIRGDFGFRPSAFSGRCWMSEWIMMLCRKKKIVERIGKKSLSLKPVCFRVLARVCCYQNLWPSWWFQKLGFKNILHLSRGDIIQYDLRRFFNHQTSLKLILGADMIIEGAIYSP